MPIGSYLLFIALFIVYFGFDPRLEKDLHIKEPALLFFAAAMIIGRFLEIPVNVGRIDMRFNAGGLLIPTLFLIYVLVRTENREHASHLLGAILISFLTVYSVNWWWQLSSYSAWVYGLVGGLSASLAIRVPTASMFGGIMGVVLADLAHTMRVASAGVSPTGSVGGAGVFDAAVIAGSFALIISLTVRRLPVPN